MAVVAEALEQMRAAPPSQVLALVLEFHATPEEALFASAASKRERLDRASAFYAALKDPLLQALGASGDVAVRDLVASPQAIVSAPARVWLELVRDGSDLAVRSDVRVVPESRFLAT